MEFFGPCKSTEAGRIFMFDGEVILMQHDGVGIYDREEKSEHQVGTVYVTNYRLLYMSRTHKLGMPLKLVSNVENTLGFLSFSHPKIIVKLTAASDAFVKLSFREGGCDNFFAKLQKSLETKAWLNNNSDNNNVTTTTITTNTNTIPNSSSTAATVIHASPPVVMTSANFNNNTTITSNTTITTTTNTNTAPNFTTAYAGVTGLIRKEEQKLKDTDETLQEAFTDLKALMENAKDLVQLAEKFGRKVAIEDSEDKQYSELLLNMGIANPVTKKTAGNAFHRELSRQLCDFLLQYMAKMDGIISLPDAYCLFNRARGTALISPHDMMAACDQFQALNLPLILKKFQSGVVVIISKDHNDSKSAKQLGEFIQRHSSITATSNNSNSNANNNTNNANNNHSSVTAFDVAEEYEISIALAKEMIKSAEIEQIIARDETPEGTRYFINKFPSFQIPSIAN